MIMDDRDFYGIMAIIGALALVSIMHSKILAQLYRDQMKVAADVAFLMDGTVIDSRETEER